MNGAYQSNVCRICSAEFSSEFVFREMMFGFKDEFLYKQCASCGCIQINTLPANIEKYYPPYYYSFNEEVEPLKRQPLLKRLVKDIRLKRIYRRKNLEFLKYLRVIRTLPSHRILDVGCGKGSLICRLFNKGFENIQGIDKFIPTEVDYGFGVKVMKKELTELPAGSYDLIMMHHVLEHVDQQQTELNDCYRLLKKNGCLMVRIPLIGKAWELYKQNWVQLDAPRHFFLHSLKSINILAAATGFEIRHTMFDSTGFQFLGSELYVRDTPLFLPDTHKLFPYEKIFSADQMNAYEKEAVHLNEIKQGDQAVFYLYKK